MISPAVVMGLMLGEFIANIPQVMGLMLGEFIDDYTVRVVDTFSMPQSGNSVTVEAVDPVFQTKMLDMLKQTGRQEMVGLVRNRVCYRKMNNSPVVAGLDVFGNADRAGSLRGPCRDQKCPAAGWSS